MLELNVKKWFCAGKGREDHRFEILNGRLIEIQHRLQKLDKKVEALMATQEERLQAISSKIDEVLSDLVTLKTNNPQLEDEISAIEAKLSITGPDEPNPAPEG